MNKYISKGTVYKKINNGYRVIYYFDDTKIIYLEYGGNNDHIGEVYRTHKFNVYSHKTGEILYYEDIETMAENLITKGLYKVYGTYKRNKTKIWSKKYVRCIKCKTTERRHQAKGYCSRCYEQQPYRRNYRKEVAERYKQSKHFKKNTKGWTKKYRNSRKGEAFKKRQARARTIKLFLKRKPFKTELDNIKVVIDGKTYLTPFKPYVKKIDNSRLSKQIGEFKNIIKQQYAKSSAI